MNHRFFICDDGYAILQGQGRDGLRLSELVSTSGNEIRVIRALIEWTFSDQLTWELSMWDKARIGRLMPFASAWSGGYPEMYRVNNLTEVLRRAKDTLAERAVALRNCAVALGLREHDRTTMTTLTVEDGEVNVTEGRHASTYIELNPIEAARLILGGPPLASQAQIPPYLTALLPIPCYVLPLDHV